MSQSEDAMEGGVLTEDGVALREGQHRQPRFREEIKFDSDESSYEMSDISGSPRGGAGTATGGVKKKIRLNAKNVEMNQQEFYENFRNANALQRT